MSSLRTFLFGFCLVLATGQAVVAAPPFALGDSDPASPYFRKRFLASYGVNERIEPVLSQSDRPLYERILPYIEKQPEQAYQILSREINRESNAAFDFLLGSLCYQMDRLPEARRWMESAIAKFPTFRRAWQTLALINVREQRYAEAIEPLLKVISLGGEDAQSYGLLGYAHLSEGNYRSALSAYEKARMFDAKSQDFKRGEAHCLLMLGKYHEAIALFEELIRQHPDEIDYWLLQCNAYLSLEQYDRAIANLELVRSMGKASVDSLYLLGDLYMREDVPQLALQAYLAVLQQEKDIQLDKALRSLQYFTERSYVEEARTYLSQLRGRIKDSVKGNDQLRLQLAEAVILQKEEKHDLAIALLQPIITADPLNGVALLRIAESYHSLEDYGQAEFYLERATSIPEYQVEALIGLARLEVAQGNFREALAFLRRAQGITPQAHIARYIEQLEQSL